MKVTFNGPTVVKTPYEKIPEGSIFREYEGGMIYLKIGYNNNFCVNHIEKKGERIHYHITLPFGTSDNPIFNAPVFGSFHPLSEMEIIPSGLVTVTF